jgi:serine O-acetyltransferase
MTGAFAADLGRCAGAARTWRTLRQLFVENYGLHALLAYRLGRWLLYHNRFYWWPVLPAGWVVYFVLSRSVRFVFDIHLQLSADIGPGLYIGHFGSLYVHHCRIGTNCSIGRLTNIGPAAGGAGPVVGERVWIGANVQIVGPYHIGPGATVSAGAVVRGDVPANALCMGDPARIVARSYDNRGILGFSDVSAAEVPALRPP